MANFYIEKIIASGTNKKDAIVTFTDGLNIIHGYSDTGKSCILKCIYFIFGGSKAPFDINATGYSTIKMIVVTDNGRTTFERKIGKNQIFVSSEDKEIENGKYDICKKKNSKNPLIDSVYLKLIGIEGDPMIITNKDFERCRLTWKIFMKILYLNEDNICTSKSLLELIEKSACTKFLSSILYLLTGNNLPEIDTQENEIIKATRKLSLETYINTQLENIASRKKELNDELNIYENMDIDKEVKRLVEILDNTEKEIIHTTQRSKNLLSNLMKLHEKETECEVSYSQLQNLKSQYISDIKRLTFIVNGETIMNEIPLNKNCPFCDGEIDSNKNLSYIESARGELTRILSQLEELTKSESDILMEKEEIQNQLLNLETEKSSMEELINHKLKPYSFKLKKSIEKYSKYLELNKELNIIESFAENFMADLHNLPQENKDKPQYRPRDYYTDSFKTKIDEYAFDILNKCKYENLTSAHFNLSDFDLEINGSKKSTSHGKGVNAFINTVLALTFRKYFANNAKFNPGLLIVDSPLLGLDQGVDDMAPESMRTALFEYFINNQSEGQMIIVENTNNMPNLDYEGSGVNVIQFTKGKIPGRYGFLYV